MLVTDSVRDLQVPVFQLLGTIFRFYAVQGQHVAPSVNSSTPN